MGNKDLARRSERILGVIRAAKTHALYLANFEKSQLGLLYDEEKDVAVLVSEAYKP
jgi:hypothetical protein